MSYDVEKLVEKIRQSGVAPRKGPEPSSELVNLVRAFENVRDVSLSKGIDKLMFSPACCILAEKLGIKKSRNRIYQIGKAALKYVEGVKLEKIDGRLWMCFDVIAVDDNQVDDDSGVDTEERDSSLQKEE